MAEKNENKDAPRSGFEKKGGQSVVGTPPRPTGNADRPPAPPKKQAPGAS